MQDRNDTWWSSQQTRRLMKISGCQLMHQREAGLLVFKKVGNAFYYQLPSHIAFAEKNSEQNHDAESSSE